MKAKPFKDSVILSSDQRQTLIKWLKETLTSASHNYVLLYRASRNGWTAANFHSFCDNKGPTVTVVKNGNYIFGGYTKQSWEGGKNICNKSSYMIEVTTVTHIYQWFKFLLILSNQILAWDDLKDRGPAWKPAKAYVASSLNMVIYLFYLLFIIITIIIHYI